MKKFLRIMVVVILSMVVFVGCSDDIDNDEVKTNSEPLVVAMELAYPPFETKDDKGEPIGVSVDFAKAFGEYIGRDIKIENMVWEGLVPSLQIGKVDMILSSMSITDKRKQIVDFSEPYANAMLAVLTNKDSIITSVEDLNQEKMKLAVKTGSTGYIYAQNNLQNAEIIALADESACVTEVVQGKADGFIYDQLTIYRNWQSNLDTTNAIFIPFQNADMWGVAVQKDNPELLAQLNEFIETYRVNGGFDKLTNKYLSEEKAAFDELGFKWFFDLD